jgi:hypothetical protein
LSQGLDLQQLFIIQYWLQFWCYSLLHWDRCWFPVNEPLHLLNQMLYEALIHPLHCCQLQLFLLAYPSLWLLIYHVAKPPVKVNILVQKNISPCQSFPVAVRKLVSKGKKFLEIVRKFFKWEFDNLFLLLLLLFTLMLVLPWPKHILYLTYCPVVELIVYYLSLIKCAIQNITCEVGEYYNVAWMTLARRIKTPLLLYLILHFDDWYCIEVICE